MLLKNNKNVCVAIAMGLLLVSLPFHDGSLQSMLLAVLHHSSKATYQYIFYVGKGKNKEVLGVSRWNSCLKVFPIPELAENQILSWKMVGQFT